MKKKLSIVIISVLASVVLLATQIITDDFNRANSGGLGANWTIRPTAADNGWDIASNQAKVLSGSGGALGWYSGAGWTGGNDQYSEFSIQSLQSGKDFGPACRISGASVATGQAYLYDINDNDAAVSLGSSISTALYKQTTGLTFTQLGASTNITISASDIIRVECNGTTIRGLVNGVSKISQTDNGIVSGNPGLYTGSGTTSTLDDWAAGDFGGGGGSTPHMRSMTGLGGLLKVRYEKNSNIPKLSIISKFSR